MKPILFYRIKEAILRIGASWDKLSPDKDTAIDFAHIHINEEPERMDDKNNFTMEYCLAASGESVNERFRQDSVNELDLRIATMVNKHASENRC